MSWQFGLSVYLIIWWVTIFMVLPWGNRAIEADDVADGQMPGAPQKPRLWTKVGINTVLAAAFWLVFYYLYTNDIIILNTY